MTPVLQPLERPLICAGTYQIAREAAYRMMRATVDAGVSVRWGAGAYTYVMSAQQLMGRRGGRLFLCDGWTNLSEAAAIRVLCRVREIETVEYALTHYQKPAQHAPRVV